MSRLSGQSLNITLTGILIAASGAALFSLKPVIIKLAYEYQVDTVTLLTLRMLYALPFYLLPLCIWLWGSPYQRPSLKQTLQAALAGICGYYLAALLDLMSLQYISAQLERLVLFTYPTLVVLTGVVLFKQPLRKGTLPALILSYCGIAIIFARDFSLQGDNILLGSLLAFGAAITFAGFIISSKPLSTALGSARFTSLAMTASSTAILTHFLISKDISALAQPLPVHGYAALMAVVATVLPSYLMAEGIRRIGAATSSLTATIGPIITAGLAVVVLGEDFTRYHLAGLILVVGGVLWMSVAALRAEKT